MHTPFTFFFYLQSMNERCFIWTKSWIAFEPFLCENVTANYLQLQFKDVIFNIEKNWNSILEQMLQHVKGLSLIRKSCLICVQMIFWLMVLIRISFWPRQSHFRSFEAVQSVSFKRKSQGCSENFSPCFFIF